MRQYMSAAGVDQINRAKKNRLHVSFQLEKNFIGCQTGALGTIYYVDNVQSTQPHLRKSAGVLIWSDPSCPYPGTRTFKRHLSASEGGCIIPLLQRFLLLCSHGS